MWRTKKVLKEPVTFSASASQELRYFWYRFLWFECLYAANGTFQTMIVDLSKLSS